MATTVDAARDEDITHNCANETYQTGNDSEASPPTWDIGFIFETSVADNHIVTQDTDGATTAPSHATGVVPIVNFANFFLTSTAATERFT